MNLVNILKMAQTIDIIKQGLLNDNTLKKKTQDAQVRWDYWTNSNLIIIKVHNQPQYPHNSPQTSNDINLI